MRQQLLGKDIYLSACSFQIQYVATVSSPGAKPPWTSGLASLRQQHRHVETGTTASRWPFNAGAAQAEVHSLGLNGSRNNLKWYCGFHGTVLVVLLVLLLWNKQMELGRHWSFCFTLNVLLFQTQAKYQLSSWVMKLQKSVKKTLVLSKMFSCILYLDVMLWFFSLFDF